MISMTLPGLPTIEGDAPGEVSVFFKTLSDPNRLRVFAQLMRGDSCNCELVAQLGIPANLLSHHLKVLSEAGLVRARRDAVDGRWIYYSVNRAVVAGWHTYLQYFLDPARIEERPLCGPEGQCDSAMTASVAFV
jgi:ArsR family transcriptional regulator